MNCRSKQVIGDKDSRQVEISGFFLFFFGGGGGGGLGVFKSSYSIFDKVIPNRMLSCVHLFKFY